MADKRKPDTVLLVRHGDSTMKVELFHGKGFPARDFVNDAGDPIPLINLGHFYRLRVDGVWFPQGTRRMYSQNQCVELIKKAVFE